VNSKRLRILIITHSAVLPTGLAEVTRLVFDALLRKYPTRYEIEQIGLKHVEAVAVAAPNWHIYPTKAAVRKDGRQGFSKCDLQGEETFRTLLPLVKPDIVFAFNDPQNLEYLCAGSTERTYKLILYVTFDGFPIPPDFNYLLKADRLITMSSFSRAAFLTSHQLNSSEKVAVIYPPADTSRFHPVSEKEKVELRREFLPRWMPSTAFVLGWVGLNQWRKQVWVLYEVMSLLRKGQYFVCTNCRRTALLHLGLTTRFLMEGAPGRLDQNPELSGTCPHCRTGHLEIAEPLDDIFLWLHMADGPNCCWPVDSLEKLYGLREGRDIYYTDRCSSTKHFRPDAMSRLYQLWDGLLYLSGGEGFGMPLFEAMSTGLPIIYTNYSSHAELVANANGGVPVGGLLLPEPHTCILRMVADLQQVLDATRMLYLDHELRWKLGANGREFTKRHSVDTQVDEWHQLFQS
jgi:glycosyltransferase involved in cell wall biosynthesis